MAAWLKKLRSAKIPSWEKIDPALVQLRGRPVVVRRTVYVDPACADLSHRRIPYTAELLGRDFSRENPARWQEHQTTTVLWRRMKSSISEMRPCSWGQPILDLGIQDPFQLTEPQLAAVMEYLYQQQAIVQAYVDETTMTDYFKTGDAVLIRGIPRQVKLLVDAGIPVSSVIPKEGSTALAFTQLLAKNAADPVCAYQWMEYSLDAKVQGATAAKFSTDPSVPAACAGASELLSAADCEHNGASKISSFFFVQTPAKNCGKDRTNCVEFQRWVDEYNALVKP